LDRERVNKGIFTHVFYSILLCMRFFIEGEMKITKK